MYTGSSQGEGPLEGKEQNMNVTMTSILPSTDGWASGTSLPPSTDGWESGTSLPD